jgi:hypothetical protein
MVDESYQNNWKLNNLEALQRRWKYLKRFKK